MPWPSHAMQISPVEVVEERETKKELRWATPAEPFFLFIVDKYMCSQMSALFDP